MVAQSGERETEDLEVACSIHAHGIYHLFDICPILTKPKLHEVEYLRKILYDIEINQSPTAYIANMKSNVKPQRPIREYKGSTLEDILDQIVRDILDENEE